MRAGDAAGKQRTEVTTRASVARANKPTQFDRESLVRRTEYSWSTINPA
jgi:hypothetical protein